MSISQTLLFVKMLTTADKLSKCMREMQRCRHEEENDRNRMKVYQTRGWGTKMNIKSSERRGGDTSSHHKRQTSWCQARDDNESERLDRDWTLFLFLQRNDRLLLILLWSCIRTFHVKKDERSEEMNISSFSFCLPLELFFSSTFFCFSCLLLTIVTCNEGSLVIFGKN